MLGGMAKFVSRKSRVALLINSNQDNPGTYVKPEIVLAVIRMCLDAGASDIGVFKRLSNSYWRRTQFFEKFRDEIREVRYIGGNHKKVAVKGQSLDVNLVRRPDLSVFDGTELITTNGPSGPGNLIRPGKVFAAEETVL